MPSPAPHIQSPVTSPHRRRTGARVRVAIASVLVLAAVWLLRLVTVWADRTASALTFLVFATTLVLLVDWLVVSLGPGLWRFMRSVAVSLWTGLRTDAEVSALVGRHPGLSGWLGRRVSRERASGLYLTVTAVGSLYFLYDFLVIVFSVVTSRAVIGYDPQLVALLRAFRSPGLTRVFWVATLAADPRVISAVAIAAVVLLVAWGRRAEAGLLAVTLSAGLLVQTLVKLAVSRQRPPAAFALVDLPRSASFPSGHALMSFLFMGVIVFIAWRSFTTLRERLATLSAALLAIIGVGLSRIYLGVHWPSDVVASWSLAMSILILACGGYLMLVRYRGLRERWPAWSTRTARITATVLVAGAVFAAVIIGALSDPLLSKVTAELPAENWSVNVLPSGALAPTDAQLKQLPLFSEKLNGTHQEPIGLVFVGTQEQLVGAFRSAGWQVADAPSIPTLARASLAALQNQPYPTAPVTPTFLDGSVQDVAFEKAAGTATVRRRHHARFWKTRFQVNGVPVWVATSSFDSRLEIGSAIPLPTHHIEPNIDAEQAYIVKDLVSTDQVAYRGRLRVTQPTAGTNAQGDTWFTQGYASVLQANR